VSDRTVSEDRNARTSASKPIIDPSANGHLSPIDRMASLLAHPDWNPTREQVADLIARAFQSGAESAAEQAYEQGRADEIARQTELNLHAIRAAIDTPSFSAAAIEADRRKQAHRARWDEWARHPHRRDHLGGAVAAW
jgi:hypothetical protein